MKRDKLGRFLKGTNGNTFEGFGVWFDRKGYPTIWIDGKNKKVHVYVWERLNGKKPKGFDIHHKDFNKANYELDNLELLSLSDHRKIHAGWVKVGEEWALKPCRDCNRLLTLDKFYERKTAGTPSNICIECVKIFYKKRNTPEYRAYSKVYMKEYYKGNKEKWQKN